MKPLSRAVRPLVVDLDLHEDDRHQMLGFLEGHRYFVRNNYYDSMLAKEAMRSGWDLQTIDEYFSGGSPQFCRGMISEEPVPNELVTRLSKIFSQEQLRSFRLFIGRAGCISDMHFDWLGGHLIHVMLHGSKDFIFLPPAAGKSLKPTGNLATVSLRSMPSADVDDLIKHYDGTLLTLNAGQALIQPPFWWHHVSYKQNSIAISAEFGEIDRYVIDVLNERRVPRDYRVASVLEWMTRTQDRTRLQDEECARLLERAACNEFDPIDWRLP